MNRYVSDRRSRRSASRFNTCACTETSRADTGSSSTTNSGSTDRARAMPARCRWPPDSSCGYRAISVGSSPTSPNRLRTRVSRASPLARRWTAIGSRTAAPIVMRGLSDPAESWKTICIRRRSARSVRRSAARTSVPSKRTVPESGSSNRRISRPSVVLPLPLSPTSPRDSPRAISRLTSSTARMVCRRPSRPPPARNVLVSRSTARRRSWLIGLAAGARPRASSGPLRRVRR